MHPVIAGVEFDYARDERERGMLAGEDSTNPDDKVRASENEAE